MKKHVNLRDGLISIVARAIADGMEVAGKVVVAVVVLRAMGVGI